MNLAGSPPLQHEFQITIERDPGKALKAVRDFVAKRDGRIISSDEGQLSADFGSSIGLRLFGVGFKEARGQLPIRLLAALESKGLQEMLNVTLTSNEGWYAFRLSRLNDLFQKKFAEMEADLKSHLNE